MVRRSPHSRPRPVDRAGWAGIGQNAGVELLVAADDRTGALEAAAALADHGAGAVPVRGWPDAPDGAIGVVDLGCRHLTPVDAASRASELPPSRRSAHKTDSTLRGNWADELAARARTTPVLLVPALPAMERTCVDGMVLDHGRPVHQGNAGTDVRRRVLTSRPAEALRSAGAGDVALLPTLADVDRWLAEPTGVAVADAADDAVIEAIAGRWASDEQGVVLAGTSAVIGAAGAALGLDGASSPPPTVGGPILIACGSVHPAARAQIDVAERQGVPVVHIADDVSARSLAAAGSLVLASEIPVGEVDEPIAVAAAAGLARGVRELHRRVPLAALVIVGGDTAAAVLGPAHVTVHGSIEPGTAWCSADGFDVPVVTRSGGFGSDRALLDLLRKLRRP